MKALLVIDMVRDFIEDEGRLTCGKPGQEIVPFIVRKVEEFISDGALVVFAVDRHRENDSEFQVFPPHCIAGTNGARLVEPLEQIVEENKDNDNVIVLPKTRYSAFYETGLDDLIRKFEVDEIHLVGVCTHICILHTAADCWYRGIPTKVYKDGVASFDGETHSFGLEHLRDVLAAEII